MADKTSGNAEQDGVSESTTPATADAAIAATVATEPDVPKMSDLQGVRYVGTKDFKSFSAEELRSIGVEPKDNDDLAWFAGNSFFVKNDRINAATRDWLATQSDFVVE